jgi:lysophospholipase L1-like esterase
MTIKSPINLSLLAFLITTTPHALAEIPVKTGDKVAFLGDSITQQGAGNPTGYVNLFTKGLAANGVEIQVIPAGISGHKSNQMLERLDRDVLSKKPQWMTLSCGVNDVWHGEKGVLLDDYKKNITSIVDQAQAAGIKVVLLTSTMIGEDATNPNNLKLAPYNEFLRTLAKEKNLLLADLNAEMQIAVTKANTPGKNALTGDGVHMAFPGNKMMATGILKCLGMNEDELAKAEDGWLDIPNTSSLKFEAKFSLREMQLMEKAAAARGTTAQKLLDEECQKIIESLKSPTP